VQNKYRYSRVSWIFSPLFFLFKLSSYAHDWLNTGKKHQEPKILWHNFYLLKRFITISVADPDPILVLFYPRDPEWIFSRSPETVNSKKKVPIFTFATPLLHRTEDPGSKIRDEKIVGSRSGIWYKTSRIRTLIKMKYKFNLKTNIFYSKSGGWSQHKEGSCFSRG
jgi:hypothetical protein